MIDLFLETIKKHRMVSAGDSVMVCVSGGADSMALLSLFVEYAAHLGIEEVFACHFNHGLRGAESEAEEQLVRAFCAALGVELLCGYGRMVEIPRPKGQGIEAHARALRYEFFEQCTEGRLHTKIALGHNQNDMAETLLLHLARGSGVRGARGMAPVRGEIIRPLFRASRDRVEQYCKERGIVYANDSTNASQDFARNRLRHGAIPVLESVNGNAIQNMARFCAHEAELWEYISGVAGMRLSKSVREKGYDSDCLLEEGELVAKYAVMLLLEQHGVDVSEPLLQTLLGLLRGDTGAVQLSASLCMRRQGRIVAVQKTAQLPKFREFQMPFAEGENLFLNNVVVRARHIYQKDVPNFRKNSQFILNNSLDCVKIIGNLVLRNRREGDVFQSLVRGCKKTIKKLFNERGIPLAQRDSIPLLCDDLGIVWVMGEGIAPRVAVDDTTKEILTLDWK